MTTLIIVESPKKAKTIGGFLGSDYRVVASRGHIRDLPPKEMGIDPDTYAMSYEVPDQSKVDALHAAVRGATRVLLATDPDREGEAIAWHLAEELRLAPGSYKRISYNAIEKSVVEAAIAAPRDIDMPRVRAQEARRALDRFCGYRVSGPLSELLSQQVSAGRVQSPAIAILVRREREIQAFQTTEHFGIELQFSGGWRAEWDTSPHLQPGKEYIQDQQLTMAVAAVKSLAVVDFTDAPTRKGPPAPFTTSTMQQAASSKLKMKTKATMDAAQSLCDTGFITYHRTDCPNVVDVTYDRMVAFYDAAGLPMAPERRVWKAKGGAQEAHDPCIPTDFNVREAGSTPEEQALYRLIWQRAVASQMPDAVYATRRAVLQGNVGGTTVRFVARGSTLTEAGWRSVYEEQEDDDKAAEAQNPIPALCAEEGVTVDKARVLKKKTKAPKRYTEGTLVQALEEEGIGRPSTYASIMTTITDRGYSVPDPKGFLRPTDLAFSIVDAMSSRFSFIELDYTRNMEQSLDLIAQGETDYLTVVAAADAQLTKELSAIEAAAPKHPCPTCGAPLRRRMSKPTESRPAAPFWACTAYPNCDCTLPDVQGVPGQRRQAVVLPDNGKRYPCPKCANPLQLRQGAAGLFFSCSTYPACKHTEPCAGGEPLSVHKCPACSSALRHVFKPGQFDFYLCTAYPACSTQLKRAPDGTPMPPATLPKQPGAPA